MKNFFLLPILLCLNLSANIDFDNIKKIAKQVDKKYVSEAVKRAFLYKSKESIKIIDIENKIEINKESKIAKFFVQAINALIKEEKKLLKKDVGSIVNTGKKSLIGLLGSSVSLSEVEYNVLVNELLNLGYKIQKFGEDDYLIFLTWKSFCRKLKIISFAGSDLPYDTSFNVGGGTGGSCSGSCCGSGCGAGCGGGSCGGGCCGR